MEPQLHENASILVDRRQPRRLKDRIYVVRTDDGVVVKRAGAEKATAGCYLANTPLGHLPLGPTTPRPSARLYGWEDRLYDERTSHVLANTPAPAFKFHKQ